MQTNQTLIRNEHSAVHAHSGQLRKNGNTPFIEHPLGVAAILIEHDQHANVIAAGLLHDVIEDTEWTAEDLLRHLPKPAAPIVVRLVQEASEPDKSLPWRARKIQTLESLPDKSLSALRVIAADKLHNVRSLSTEVAYLGECAWDLFNAGKPPQCWYYTSMATQLAAAVVPAHIAASLPFSDLATHEPLFQTLLDTTEALFPALPRNFRTCHVTLDQPTGIPYSPRHGARF